MKKPTCIIVALLLIVGALASCAPASGGTTQASAQTTAPAETQPAETAPAETAPSEAPSNGTDEFVTITSYMRKCVDNSSGEQAVEDEVNQYFRERINAELDIRLIDNVAYEDRIRMMSAAGEEYDLVESSFEANATNRAVANGTLFPLDELLDKYGPSIREKVDPRAWAVTTYGGQIYSIPGQMPWSSPRGFAYRKDLVEKYGFDYTEVKSFKDLEPFFQTIKENEPGVTPFSGDTSWLRNPESIEIADGVIYDEANDKLLIMTDDPVQLGMWREYGEAYAKGYIPSDVLVIQADSLAEMSTGKYAVFGDGGIYDATFAKATGMVGFPCVESLVLVPKIRTASVGTAGTAISSTSKNPERAMMLNDMIWEDSYISNTLAYGIEGQDYQVTKGDVRGPYADVEVVANSGDQQRWAIWHPRLGPLWEQWSSNWNTQEALQQMKYDNENAEASKVLGFIFDPEPVRESVAPISSIISEASLILNAGTQGENVDSYVAELRQRLIAAGVETVLAEAQKQLDAWKADAER
ncbi:MAG: extracellular solute-binding protein [Clostridiales bacterium]|jgi:putative aldouronate transport system substrate-binding protein|nr:extracellular solute-binding protein [Clostridiales bacterium]